MNFSNKMNLNDLKCCMPNRPVHFVQNQRILSCGHPVCSACAADAVDIKCVRCNALNKSELSSSFDYIDRLSEKYIESNLKDFHQALYIDLAKTIADIQSHACHADEKINRQFELAELNLQIKVDCMKTSLDSIQEQFKDKLAEAKSKIKACVTLQVVLLASGQGTQF